MDYYTLEYVNASIISLPNICQVRKEPVHCNFGIVDSILVQYLYLLMWCLWLMGSLAASPMNTISVFWCKFYFDTIYIPTNTHFSLEII